MFAASLYLLLMRAHQEKHVLCQVPKLMGRFRGKTGFRGKLERFRGKLEQMASEVRWKEEAQRESDSRLRLSEWQLRRQQHQ